MTRKNRAHLRSWPRFVLLPSYCELCQSPLYIENDTQLCTHCDWFEALNSEVPK